MKRCLLCFLLVIMCLFTGCSDAHVGNGTLEEPVSFLLFQQNILFLQLFAHSPLRCIYEAHQAGFRRQPLRKNI